MLTSRWFGFLCEKLLFKIGILNFSTQYTNFQHNICTNFQYFSLILNFNFSYKTWIVSKSVRMQTLKITRAVFSQCTVGIHLIFMLQAHQRLKITKDHTIKPKEEADLESNSHNNVESKLKTISCPLHPQVGDLMSPLIKGKSSFYWYPYFLHFRRRDYHYFVRLVINWRVEIVNSLSTGSISTSLSMKSHLKLDAILIIF